MEHIHIYSTDQEFQEYLSADLADFLNQYSQITDNQLTASYGNIVINDVTTPAITIQGSPTKDDTLDWNDLMSAYMDASGGYVSSVASEGDISTDTTIDSDETWDTTPMC